MNTPLVLIAALALSVSSLAAARLHAAGPAAATPPPAPAATSTPCPAFLDRDFRKLHSSATVNLCKAHAGKPLLMAAAALAIGLLALPMATAGSPYVTVLAIDLLTAALFAASLHYRCGRRVRTQSA